MKRGLSDFPAGMLVEGYLHGQKWASSRHRADKITAPHRKSCKLSPKKARQSSVKCRQWGSGQYQPLEIQGMRRECYRHKFMTESSPPWTCLHTSWQFSSEVRILKTHKSGFENKIIYIKVAEKLPNIKILLLFLLSTEKCIAIKRQHISCGVFSHISFGKYFDGKY